MTIWSCVSLAISVFTNRNQAFCWAQRANDEGTARRLTSHGTDHHMGGSGFRRDRKGTIERKPAWARSLWPRYTDASLWEAMTPNQPPTNSVQGGVASIPRCGQNVVHTGQTGRNAIIHEGVAHLGHPPLAVSGSPPPSTALLLLTKAPPNFLPCLPFSCNPEGTTLCSKYAGTVLVDHGVHGRWQPSHPPGQASRRSSIPSARRVSQGYYDRHLAHACSEYHSQGHQTRQHSPCPRKKAEGQNKW